MDLSSHAANSVERRHRYPPTWETGIMFELQVPQVLSPLKPQEFLPGQGQKRWAVKVKTGCLTCRRRRVKCDETKPACKRCTRFARHCDGYGYGDNNSLPPYAEVAQQLLHGPKSSLSNTDNRVSNVLIYYLESPRPGYSVVPWRPYLISQLPQRMGHSEAFDASVAAFASLLETSLHLPSPFEQPSKRSLQLYITGIKALQKALADPVTRYNSSTLYSAYTLEQCHIWMSRSAPMRGHNAGLLHLMHIILLEKPKDQFLLRLCHAVEAELLCAAFYNPNIQLFPWIETLLETTERSAPDWPGTVKVKPPTVEVKWLCLFPNLIRNPKKNKQQVQSAYDYILNRFLQAKSYIKSMKGEPDWTMNKASMMNESYAGYITIGCVLNAFLRAFNPSNMLLHQQKRVFCASAVTLAKSAMHERPLSAHHIPETLLAAWCVADSAEGDLKARLRELIDDYRQTFATGRVILHMATWQEAPAQLREIPWITLPDRKDGGSHERSAQATENLTEYCCIL